MDFISIDKGNLDAITAAWAKAPEIVAEELLAAVTEAEALLERVVKERAPSGASAGGASGLKGSIYSAETVAGATVLGMVASPLKYAEPVELGTKPHMPPIQPLIDWVKVKFGLSDAPIAISSWEKGASERWPTSNPNDATPTKAWRKVKGGIERQSEASKRAWAIAWGIYHHGTPGIGMFHLSLAYNETELQGIFSRAITRIGSRIAVIS